MTDKHAIPHADLLSHVTTATLTLLLNRLGERNTFMEGISPLDPIAKIAPAPSATSPPAVPPRMDPAAAKVIPSAWLSSPSSPATYSF